MADKLGLEKFIGIALVYIREVFMKTFMYVGNVSLNNSGVHCRS
jgi:hypothetical protein